MATMIKWFKNWFRQRYEDRISLPNGYMRFLANFYLLQMGPDDYLTLTSPHKSLGDVTVTAVDGRPMLAYKFWPRRMEWTENLPLVKIILEEKRIQHNDGENDWGVTDLTHPKVKPLRDLFLGCAFYMPMRKEHVKKRVVDAKGA